MASQESASQMIRSGKATLEQALKLLVNDNAELNPDYLDKQLLSSMKSNWPQDKAVPLIYAQKQLFVGTTDEPGPDFAKQISSLVSNTPVKLIKINRESWDAWKSGTPAAPKKSFVSADLSQKPAEPAKKEEAPVNKAKVSATTSQSRKPKTETVGKKVSKALGAELAATIEEIPVRYVSATDENSIGNDVRALMAEAAEMGTSDIHFEPTEKYLVVRYRIDGVLRDICRYKCTAKEDYRKIIIARIKIIADLNIAESRLPQDGRVTESLDGKKIDLRVSTLPVMYGEKCVIRLLPHELSFSELEDLGMPSDKIPDFESWLNMSQGMVLITGPTGSGKTSTLYTSLAKVLDISKNVVTVEDPVEYQLARVNQVQVNAKAGLNFAAGLRSILRQDPDIVMIGEIRDTETVEIAIQAALTGHLVLSTLHTNDAPSSISRLTDMGAQPFLISSALVGVIAQRLVRKVCPKCCEEYTPSEKELQTLGLPPGDYTFVHAKGCQECNDTGYSGREGIFEIMPVTTKMKAMIQERVGLNKIKEYLQENGVDTLYECGVSKIVQRLTTVEEVLRVVPPEARITS